MSAPIQRKYLLVILIACVIFSAACAVNVAERNAAGNRQYRAEDYEAALRSYQAAMVDAPDRPEPYYNAASALAGLEQFSLAAAALEQAIRTGDEELIARAHYNLGNVYFLMGDFDRAAEAYRQTLLLDPDDDDARYNLELTLRRRLPATPTAIEQQTQPEQGETDPEITPTNEPAGQDGPTPTPPPQDITPEPSATPEGGEQADAGNDPSTPVPRDGGEMTIEQAERLLDAVQQDQQALRQFLRDTSPSGEPGERDW